MAIQYPNFLGAPVQESPLKGLFEKVLNAYQLPGQLKAQQEKAATEAQLKQAMTQKAMAEAQKAGRPADLNSALAQAFQLRDKYPEGSPDRQKVEDYIKKLGTSNQGVSVSGGPEGFQIDIGGQGEKGNISELGKLKPGSVWIKDDEGKVVARGDPYSEKEKTEYGGREFFNMIQPFLSEAQAPYTGRGSVKRFEEDVAKYATDPEAKERIDNLLAAEKLMFSGTVKENATLGGANTNKVYDRLTKSLETSDVYPLLKNIAKSYQLPNGFSQASDEIFNERLNEASEASKQIPAFKISRLNKSLSHEHAQKLSHKLKSGNKEKILNLVTGEYE